MWKIIVGALLGIGLMVYLGTRGCGESLTQNLLAYGDNAMKSLEEFEQTNETFRREIQKTVGKTRDLLNKKPEADLPGAAEVWERDWKRILKQFGGLDDRFKETKINGKKYLVVLEELANGMVNPDRRKREKEKYEEVKKEWDQAHEEASSNMNRLRSILVEGSDVHRMIVSATLRKMVKESIAELDKIASEAQRLLDFLDQFADDAKELVTESRLPTPTEDKGAERSPSKEEGIK